MQIKGDKQMKTLYLDCSSGAAGDMISAALWELIDSQEAFLEKVNGIGIPDTKIYALPSVKKGISGTHFTVTVAGREEWTEDLEKDSPVKPVLNIENHINEEHVHVHEHEHSHGGETHSHPHSHSHSHGEHAHKTLEDINSIINSLDVSDRVKRDAVNVYELLADAESMVHGVSVSNIHFHEVGTMEAIADIVCTSMLIEEINPERIIASPVHTGSGKVKCEHGILPVPAPATTILLRGIPVYSSDTNGELCTPTGAALLKYFVSDFGPMPVMNIEAIGYGMGAKDYDMANCLRALLGEAAVDPKTQNTGLSEDFKLNRPPAGDEKKRKAITNRIARSLGHLESVKRMVESDRDAMDILIQLSAVESSISATSRYIIKEYFKSAIDKAVKENDRESIENLYKIVDKFIR